MTQADELRNRAIELLRSQLNISDDNDYSYIEEIVDCIINAAVIIALGSVKSNSRL